MVVMHVTRLFGLAILLSLCLVHAANAEQPKYVPHPSLDEMKQGLERWSRLQPNRIKVETVGRSSGGNPMLLAIVTDHDVPDEDKQVVLLTASHAGDELTGCNGFLHLTRWLIGDDPLAAKIRKNVITLVMPCINPDGYSHMTSDSPWSRKRCHKTAKGKETWGAYNWDGPRDPENTPEVVAVVKVADKYEPDAAFEAHGCWYENHSMWESTGFSWGDNRAHTFCPAMAEQMNLAAEKEGFLIIRPPEDSGRIKVTAPVAGAENHFYRISNILGPSTFFYNRYHTLAFNSESGFDDSVVARAKKLLELGTTRWRNEFYTGYPVNQLGGWGSMTICAWGDTAKRRRQSRVELWKNSDRLFFSIGVDQPAHDKMMAVCATTVPAAMRYIGNGAMPTVLKNIKEHPEIDAAAIEQFVKGTLINRFEHPNKRTFERGYNRKNTSEEPIRHGLAMRLFIPHVDARIVDARINGHPASESATEGYQVRHGPGTIVQFNIPPGKVGDIHFVTCRYQTKKRHRQGFRPEDWTLDGDRTPNSTRKMDVRPRPIALGTLIAWLVFLQAALFAEDRLAPTDPGEVKVGGEIGRRIDITINNNLLVLDIDKDFLSQFRHRKKTRYIGLGKLIDATISFGKHTENPRIIKLKDHLIDELLKTQLPNGYVGLFPEEKRLSAYWDLHEMVYIIQALVADYREFGNRRSLEAARRMGDYIIAHRKGTDEPRLVGKLGTERAFIALSRATGEKRYRDYAVNGMDLRNWDQPMWGHSYTYLNVCLAQLDLYEIERDDRLLSQSRKVIDFLTAKDGWLVDGSCSMHEWWHSDQKITGKAGETCATAYLIRWLHRLQCIEGTSNYGDMMERAIYSALFSAQVPNGRRLFYYRPLEGKRTLYKLDTFCCPNNYRRIIAELPQLIYYRANEGGVAVNLYTPSSAVIPLDKKLKLVVRQETDYPNSGKVTIRLDPSRPAEFPLRLRIPAWCKQATVSVNGQKLDQPVTSGEYLTVKRKWKPGDRVKLDMPMTWRLVRGRKLQTGRVAVVRGPLLFCLDPQRLSAMNPHMETILEEVKARKPLLSKKWHETVTALGVLDGRPVDLADIVGGGHGFGSGKPQQGIHPYTGKATQGDATSLEGKANQFAAAESPFVDGVVVPDGGPDGKTRVPVSSSGLMLSGVPNTMGQTYDYIKSGPIKGQRKIDVGGINYTTQGNTMLAMHANKIVTFDLNAIRKATGYRGLRFRSTLGYGSRPGKPSSTVDIAVHVDGKPVVDPPVRVTGAGDLVDVSIPADARFLSLAVTDGGYVMRHDFAFFGNPRLYPDPPIGLETDDDTILRKRLLAELDATKRKLADYQPFPIVVETLRIDPRSFGKPVKDSTVRPDGLACPVRAWSPGRSLSEPPDLKLLLTEFADPAGEATYFLVPDAATTVEDELAHPTKPISSNDNSSR